MTQNTDGLHQDSGCRRVIEVHGSSRTVQCLDCGARESRADVQARLDVEMPPHCKVCGGTFLKPTVVLFGEPMPVPRGAGGLCAGARRGRDARRRLVAGRPPRGRHPPGRRPGSGARLIIVNAEPTPLDSLAEVVIHGRSGEVLPEIVSLLDA